MGEVFKKKEKGEKKEREGIRGEQGSLRVEKGKMEQGGGVNLQHSGRRKILNHGAIYTPLYIETSLLGLIVRGIAAYIA